MGALGLQNDSKPATGEMPVSLTQLAELTGFPVDFIRRELLLEEESNLSVDELREKVMIYLKTNF